MSKASKEIFIMVNREVNTRRITKKDYVIDEAKQCQVPGAQKVDCIKQSFFKPGDGLPWFGPTLGEQNPVGSVF